MFDERLHGVASGPGCRCERACRARLPPARVAAPSRTHRRGYGVFDTDALQRLCFVRAAFEAGVGLDLLSRLCRALDAPGETFDLVVPGAGSTAFAAVLRAVAFGKTVALTESRVLGGTCANRGCLPSKNLIEAAKILYESTHPRYPGLRPASMELDFPALRLPHRSHVARSA